MMEPSKEPINVRTKRIINNIIGNSSNTEETLSLLTREGLLDALDVLYEECNSECLKNADKNIKKFVERHKKTIGDLKKLRVNLSDFEIKNVIGRGHFGEVRVVKEKQTGHIYAMKTIKKYKSLEEKYASFEVERNIMAFSTSPWLTSLQYAFQDVANLYFIMDYHPGGDLVGLLYRQGGTLPESAARFYIAELVVALHDLHQMGYVHRDIKPDNILLDRCGHVKIVDFGSAALLNSKGEMSNVMPVGTPDYIAPEILQSFDNRTKKAYGISCDYWSLGVLGYELTVGNTPFNGSNTTSIYSKIMNHQTTLKFPSDIILTQGFVALIRNLLTDEDHRLSYEEILKHPVYKNVDFDSLRDQVPPYVPKISSIDDTSNFIDVAKTRNEPHIDNFKRKTQFSGKNLSFIGFTYTPFIEMNNEGLTKCIVKDETITTLKKELEKLQKKLMQVSDFGEKENYERKLDEKTRKLESIENVRKNLEKDLAKTIAECSALKRKLDLERKDRSEVEKKALELIKASKLKWEAAEKPKMEALEIELGNYKEKVAKIEFENKNLIDQINQVGLLENKHKVSLEKVENLRRSSVVGLETRLQKLTHQSQKELNELQSKLMEENKKNIDYEKVLNELKMINTQFKIEINEKSVELEECKKKINESNLIASNLKDEKIVNKQFQKSIDGYKKEIEIYKEEINELKSKIINKDFLESKIKFEQEINERFKQQIEDLKTELNFEKLSNKSTQEEVNSNFKLQSRALEVKIRDLLAEKNDIQCKLKEAESKEEDHKRKINTLESLVKELERGVDELEDTSDRQGVLQKQVERLEQQLVETHEQFALEKQELSQLKSKYWRMERELQNSNLDKKIIERDYKEAKDQNNQLTQDIEAMMVQINENKTTNEKALLELNGLNENLTTEVIKLSDLVKNLEDKLSTQREKSDDEKDAFNELRTDLRKKDEEIRQLRNQINDLMSEKCKWERRVFEITKQNEVINVQINKESNEKNVLIKEIEDLKRKINNSQQNQNALREACSLLETQLEEFEHLYQVSESKRTSLINEVEKLNWDLSTTRNDVQEAKRSTNEEKSLRLLSETKSKKLIEDLESLQQQLGSYREECTDFKSYSSNLANELTSAEQKITDLDVELRDCKRKLEDYLAENLMIKEENSSQLTYLNNLKESNFKLSQNLNEYKTVNKTVIDQVNSLETLLSEREMCFKEREIKMDATIHQQIKLIDYLQSKIEEKKKKTLTDKLFGGSKKENQQPLPIVLNYKDLEQQLFKEKETNKNLQEEIFKLKSITLPNLNSKMNIRDQKKLLEQIVQSPQKNDLYRQNSVQRMQHNIPHRFESKLCTKSNICGQCGDSLQIGRGSSFCRECLIQVHTGCAKNVPRTCGLPQGFAKHYSDSLSRLKTKKELESENEKCEDEEDSGNVVFDVEGYVKVPVKSSWEKYYACLTSKSLIIYEEPPNNTTTKIVDKLKLNQLGTHGKVTLEPVESEIGIPVANSDLPFIIKVEISPKTTCWPPKNIIFMTLSVEDKDKWYKALDKLFISPTGKYTGDVVLKLQEDFEVNCLIEFGEDSKLCGTDRGLFSYKNETFSHISGPLHVQQITSVQKLNLVVMIVDENRVLITCDYKHLQNLTLCAPCSKPTLQFNAVNIKNIDGFHIFSVSTKKDLLCAATARQIVIMFYDIKLREYIPERILDTAEPTSCILFTEYTLLIGADKFFEIDLNNYEVDEFLDSSDRNLSLAISCYKLKSFPLAILEVSKHPVEYLLCYNEFAVFVDEYGRNSRKNEIKFNHLPSAFYFTNNHLFVVQLSAVDIIKIKSPSNQEDKNDDVDFEHIKIDLASPKYLGSSKKGIYIKNQKLIKYITYKEVSDLISDLDTSTDSEAFSFTSSMVRSLDGQLSDDEGDFENEKRVKFARTTDL